MPPGTDRRNLLHLRFLRTARRRWFSFAMADSSGRELTYGKALAGSLALASKIRGRCGDDRMVGLMLPASVGGVLANIATLMAGKVPVNLNFTAGAEAIAAAVDQCGIRTVITSKVFLAKAKLATPEGAWFLEDVMKTISPVLRLGMLVAGLLLPARVIEWLFIRGERDPDGLATIIFSSGSTGMPKGVMLSHRNVLANVEGIARVYEMTDDDRLMGVLPLFHSFGFTGRRLASAAHRLRRRLSPEPSRRGHDRRIGQEVSGDDASSARRASASAMRGSAASSEFATLRYVGRRRREAARADRPRVQGEVRPGTDGGLWVHRDVAGRFRECA